MFDIRILNPLSFPNWDDLLAPHPEATVFHTAGWAAVLARSYGYTPLYLAQFDGDRLAALLPLMEVKSLFTGKRGVSLPFTDACEFLGDEGSLKALFERTRALGRERGWKYLEVRGTAEPAAGAVPSEVFAGHQIDLAAGEERVFSSFRESTRRNIRKAELQGVEVRVTEAAEGLEQFRSLNTLTRKRHGLPPQPASFFRNLHDLVLAKGRGFVGLASHGGRVVAGGVYLHFGRHGVYKYGASDLARQHLRANNLVMAGAIRWYLRHGFLDLSFGRTEPGNQGLLQFKAGWGGTEEPVRYYRFDLQRDAFSIVRSKVDGVHNRVFRAMPIPILSRVGTFLYRHVG